ncbi:hypothetical protein SADUNF_Sadunf12G0094500 [Salix dunnii]|uniref:Protein PHLOEM PROTEIN 2-LIKE A9-like n=1 Tax=Salix dunnii TaxID=1413687 RepID=A0A835JJ91_9ROSI|nr:hypothetical protein SADUNF_Sadunf12G0094500 [Salix dunnii]
MSSKESDHEAEPDEILKIENSFSCLQDRKSWRFKPRGFSITWSSNKSFWNIPEKGTDGPAELRMVCWLEIKGSIPEPLSKGARYALSFKISLTEDNFGWENAPAFMMAKVGKKGRAKWARINLEDVEENTEIEVPFGKLRFEVPSNAEDTILNFGFYELWNGGWKGGWPEELLQACWYEVTGSDHHDTKVKKSEIKFKLSMKNNAISWTDTPFWTMAETAKKKGGCQWSKINQSKLGEESKEIPGVVSECFKTLMKYRKQQIATPGHSNRGASTSYGAVTNATGTCLRKGTTTESLPKGKYEIKFKLQVKQGAFGLYDSPIFMMAKVGKRGRYKWRKIKLPQISDSSPATTEPFQIEVDETKDENKLYFGLYEVWNGKWKGGLLIHEATVKPV